MQELSTEVEASEVDASEVEANRQVSVPAWLLSLVTHLSILVLLGLLIRPITKGVQEESTRQVGIVAAVQKASQTEYFDETNFDELTTDSSAESSESSQLAPSTADSPLDVSGVFPTLDGLVGPAGEQASQLPNTSELLQGLGSSNGEIGNQASTTVFGVQGTGSRFVFVFDRSSSMGGFGGRPLAAAKREMLGALVGLGSTHQFQVIFYNDDPAVFNPNPSQSPQLLFGSEENIELAQRFIGSIQARGGTRHLEPLYLALNMGPDVVYFLTDAQEPQLTVQQLAQIRRRNRSSASINTIEFGEGPQRDRNNFLVRMADQNQGQHVYVDVTKLPRR